MVLCLIALPIFAILGIFSVKYRKLTKDALECLFRTVTLRKCESGLDDRIKAGITGSLFGISPKISKIVYKYYKVLSWIFVILMVWSIYESGVGIYNYTQYGNCNGPESVGFCPLDPTGKNSKISELGIEIPENPILPIRNEENPLRGDPNAQLTIIEFGCYACPYTKNAEPIIEQLLDIYEGQINIEFKNFIIPHHEEALPSAIAANCAFAQDQYEPYHKALFKDQENQSAELYTQIAIDLGLNVTAFESCLNDSKVAEEIDADTVMGYQAGVIGTPTFFIGDQKIVGPKPFRTFKKIIEDELE